MPTLTSHREVAIDGQVESSYQELAESLHSAGVDLIIAEMMRDVENAGIVIRAAVSTGLPVLIGFSAMMAENGVDVRSLPGFDGGAVSVQDAGAQLAAWLLDP